MFFYFKIFCILGPLVGYWRLVTMNLSVHCSEDQKCAYLDTRQICKYFLVCLRGSLCYYHSRICSHNYSSFSHSILCEEAVHYIRMLSSLRPQKQNPPKKKKEKAKFVLSRLTILFHVLAGSFSALISL